MFKLRCFYFLTSILPLAYAADLYSKFNQHDYKIEYVRQEIVDYNKDFFEIYKSVTFKYNRSLAVTNTTLKAKLFIDNRDTQVIIQVYKFYSNEYRTFPIRIQLNFCNCVNNNLIGLRKSFSKCGNFSTCSFKKGVIYHLCNWTPDELKFPPLIPNGEYKIELTILVNDSMSVIMNHYGRVYRPMKWT